MSLSTLNCPLNYIFTCKNWILLFFFAQVETRPKAEVNCVLFNQWVFSWHRLSFFNRFCSIWWVEDKHVAERAMEMWEPLKKVIKYWESLSKSQHPTNKSYMNAYNVTTQIFLFLANCSFLLLLLEFLNHIWWYSRLIGQWCPLCCWVRKDLWQTASAHILPRVSFSSNHK